MQIVNTRAVELRHGAAIARRLILWSKSIVTAPPLRESRKHLHTARKEANPEPIKPVLFPRCEPWNETPCPTCAALWAEAAGVLQ